MSAQTGPTTEPTSAPTTYERAARLPFRTFEGQTVIVNPGNREVHVLNGTGTTIWDLLQRRQSLQQLATALQAAGQFDADPAVMLEDLRGFLDDLAKKGLLADERPAAAV